MKALIQRVMNAKVTVNDEIISSIGKGICVFIGISNNDTKEDMEYIVRKILSIRIFDDEFSRSWKKSVSDRELEILCGNKPDFHNAMPGEESEGFYKDFIYMLKDAYKPDKVKDGKFAAYMQVSLQNDGPVTFEIQSPSNLPTKESTNHGLKHIQSSSNQVDESYDNGIGS